MNLVFLLLCTFCGPLLILAQDEGDFRFFTSALECTSDSYCQDTMNLTNSRCVWRNTYTNGEGFNITGYFCGCDSKHGWEVDGGQCTLQVEPEKHCRDDGNSVCVDVNSECVYDGVWDSHFCKCKVGYIVVQRPDTLRDFDCVKKISAAQDPNCAACIDNGGICYDKDNDGEKDGCQCMLSQSGVDCETFHLRVMCTGENKTLCYGPPQEGVDFNDGSIFYADGKGDLPGCIGEVLDEDTDGCLAGYNRLVLPLEAGRRERCGTVVIKKEGDERLETMVSVKRMDSEHVYHYKTYCTFASEMDSISKGIGVIASQGHAMAAGGNDRGQTLRPTLSLGALTSNRMPMGNNPTIRDGTPVFFDLMLGNSDPAVYEAMKADECMFSTSGSMSPSDMNRADTRLIIKDGCPATRQTQVTTDNNFKPNIGSLLDLRTGLIPLYKFSTSNSLFLHCTVLLCTKSNMDDCNPSDCSGENGHGRRKRSTVELDNANSASVAAYLRFTDDNDNDDGTAAESSGGTTSIVGMSTAGFIGAVLILIVILLAFVIIAVFLLWRVKNKRAKVEDHNPGRPQNFALPRMQRNQNV